WTEGLTREDHDVDSGIQGLRNRPSGIQFTREEPDRQSPIRGMQDPARPDRKCQLSITFHGEANKGALERSKEHTALPQGHQRRETPPRSSWKPKGEGGTASLHRCEFWTTTRSKVHHRSGDPTLRCER